jgi:hypothetical protein
MKRERQMARLFIRTAVALAVQPIAIDETYRHAFQPAVRLSRHSYRY